MFEVFDVVTYHINFSANYRFSFHYYFTEYLNRFFTELLIIRCANNLLPNNRYLHNLIDYNQYNQFLIIRLHLRL